MNYCLLLCRFELYEPLWFNFNTTMNHCGKFNQGKTQKKNREINTLQGFFGADIVAFQCI